MWREDTYVVHCTSPVGSDRTGGVLHLVHHCGGCAEKPRIPCNKSASAHYAQSNLKKKKIQVDTRAKFWSSLGPLEFIISIFIANNHITCNIIIKHDRAPTTHRHSTLLLILLASFVFVYSIRKKHSKIYWSTKSDSIFPVIKIQKAKQTKFPLYTTLRVSYPACTRGNDLAGQNPIALLYLLNRTRTALPHPKFDNKKNIIISVFHRLSTYHIPWNTIFFSFSHNRKPATAS